MSPIQHADLLTQVNDLIASFEAECADAENWRSLKARTAELGYGPRLSIDDIIHLLPDPIAIARIVADSQEVSAPAQAPKMQRITKQLRRRVWDLADADKTYLDIAKTLAVPHDVIDSIIAAGRPG